MEDPAQRERESEEEPKTKFEQEGEAERATTERVADDIRNAPLTERDEE